MNISIGELREKLAGKKLKVTPQRIAVLEAIHQIGNHPSADQITGFIRVNHPNVATGTIYKVLDVLEKNGLISRVKTERDAMRYESRMDAHHHLYCTESDRIEDYTDEELNHLLEEYFKKKNIPGFLIEDIRLQIKGNFTNTLTT